MKVIIFAPQDMHSVEISGAMDVFAEANSGSQQPYYEVAVVAERPDPIRCASGLRIVPDHAITESDTPLDTLIVAGSYGAPRPAPEQVVRWIARNAAHARRYGAVCAGAFLLGAAGLIDGRRVTTHWQYADRLAAEYPRAIVVPDRILVRDGRLFTSAGVTAAIDLALALVEEDLGRDLALCVAGRLAVHVTRAGGQSRFSAPLSAQAVLPTPISRARTWIVEYPADDLGLTALAARAAMSPRNFSRVFRRETRVSPAEFVERARLDVARRLLEESAMPLDQVARAIGFASAASVRRVFLRRLSITPSQYRQRFRSSGSA
jgi:transcriptional regulator GlxA family with amidase domain